MRNKIVCVVIWLVMSILYCANIIDIGRSMGAKVNGAMEALVNASEGEVSASFAYGQYYSDLDESFKFDFTIISITTVAYVATSGICLIYGTKVGKH